MENLRLTHNDWYALPKWEREVWIARELDKEEKVKELIDSVRRMEKNSAYGLNAMVMLHTLVL